MTEELVDLCVGECPYCTFDEDHPKVTKAEYAQVIARHTANMQKMFGHDPTQLPTKE